MATEEFYQFESNPNVLFLDESGGLLRRLRDHRKLIVEIPVVNPPNPVFEFSLKGSAAAIDEILSNCQKRGEIRYQDWTLASGTDKMDGTRLWTAMSDQVFPTMRFGDSPPPGLSDLGGVLAFACKPGHGGHLSIALSRSVNLDAAGTSAMFPVKWDDTISSWEFNWIESNPSVLSFSSPETVLEYLRDHRILRVEIPVVGSVYPVFQFSLNGSVGAIFGAIRGCI